jgi:hypothetical protein
MAKKPKVAIVHRDPGRPAINFFALLLGVILLFLIGCSSQAPDPGTSPQLSHKTSMPTALRSLSNGQEMILPQSKIWKPGVKSKPSSRKKAWAGL